MTLFNSLPVSLCLLCAAIPAARAEGAIDGTSVLRNLNAVLEGVGQRHVFPGDQAGLSAVVAAVKRLDAQTLGRMLEGASHVETFVGVSGGQGGQRDRHDGTTIARALEGLSHANTLHGLERARGTKAGFELGTVVVEQAIQTTQGPRGVALRGSYENTVHHRQEIKLNAWVAEVGGRESLVLKDAKWSASVAIPLKSAPPTGGVRSYRLPSRRFLQSRRGKPSGGRSMPVK